MDSRPRKDGQDPAAKLTNAVSNHYETLGVAKTATPEELKSAFRKLAKQHHPDLGGDAAKFQQINEAYETLSDPQKRAHYDHVSTRPQQDPFGGDPDPFGFGFAYNPMNEAFTQHFNFVFRNGEGAQMNRQLRNKNLRISLEMGLLDTLEEQHKVFDIRLSNGTDHLDIKIPAGVADGNVLSIKGKGDNEHANVPRGNLEIAIKVLPHPIFTRQGDNISMDMTIDCFEAILGKDVEIDCPSGKRISLRIPAGTQNGTVFGVSDEGFPSSPRFNRGRLLIRVNVRVPQNLTPEQLVLVKDIHDMRPVNS
jgi:curved DNA-binding protein